MASILLVDQVQIAIAGLNRPLGRGTDVPIPGGDPPTPTKCTNVHVGGAAALEGQGLVWMGVLRSGIRIFWYVLLPGLPLEPAPGSNLLSSKH